MEEISYSTVFSLIVIGWSVYFWKLWKNSSQTSPPEPSLLAIINGLYKIVIKSQSPATVLHHLANICGDVMTLNVGIVKAVVFSSHEAIREVLKSDYSVDRVLIPVIRDRNMHQNLGLIWGNGEKWQTTRRFTLRHLKDFGFGKTQQMDLVINDECSQFLHHFRHIITQSVNNVVTIEGIFYLPFLNNLWRLVVGKGYDYNDPEIHRLLNLQSAFLQTTNLLVHPILPSFVRNVFPKWSKKSEQMEAFTNLFEFGKTALEEHKKYLQNNPDAAPRGFLDVFVSKLGDPNHKNSAFTDENCIMSFLDLLMAGSDTSSNVLSFGILYMILNPKIQAKVQAEIDSKVNRHQPIVTEMRQILPYTHATLLEILRNGLVLRIPTPRQATQDFKFRNYFVKKGTFLVTNLEASHFNKGTWGDPEIFRPERFLNKDETQVDVNVAKLLDAFGAGKRVCIGQGIAEASLLIFFVSLMREFQFVQVEGQQPSTVPVPGGVSVPRPFQVKVIERL